MPDLPASLTRELGAPGVTAPGGFLDTFEETPELRWPQSTLVYDRMRKTDGQTGAVLRAIGLPIRRTRWRIAGADVDPRVAAFVEAELGLQLDEQGRRRRRREGISFSEHLRHALISLPVGHMPFEQVYAIGDPPPGIAGLPPVVAHLRKLAPRMPRTISGFVLASDGGLDAVRQLTLDDRGRLIEVTIPIERLAIYVNEREGSDWAGTSILRVAYKHWLLKDMFLRLAGIAGERNSLGLPVVTHGPNVSERQALAVASAARSGEKAGVAVPQGMTFALEGVRGSTFNLLEWVKYHDESIGRSALAMFLNLGHDNGARALGDTFVDFFALSEGAVIDELEEVLAEHIIRDLVVLNFGPDEPYPMAVADPIDGRGPLTAEAIATLVDSGVILPDDPLEDEIRRSGGLPPAARSSGGPGAPPVEVMPPGPQPMPPVRDPGALPPGNVQPPGPIPAAPPAPAAARGGDLAALEARLDAVRRQLEARRRARRAHTAPAPAAP